MSITVNETKMKPKNKFGPVPKAIKDILNFDITTANTFLYHKDNVDKLLCYHYDDYVMGITYKNDKYTERKLAFKDQQSAKTFCDYMKWTFEWQQK